VSVQPINRRFFIFCLAATLFAASASSQDAKSLVGTWSMTSETDDDPVAWTLILKQVEGKLTASVDSGQAEQPVKDFTSSDGVLRFKVPYEGVDYDIELKAAEDKLIGTWNGGGNSGKTAGTKK
jgi:hypothetical protein